VLVSYGTKALGFFWARDRPGAASQTASAMRLMITLGR